MKKVFIYSLSIDGAPFYIGKTVNIESRFKKHVSSGRFPNGFKIDIVDEIPESEWQFWEIHYISLFKCWGFKLYNISEGGDIQFKVRTNFSKKIKSDNRIKRYCKCENCSKFFTITKKQLYCSDSCKKKAYYIRKKATNKPT